MEALSVIPQHVKVLNERAPEPLEQSVLAGRLVLLSSAADLDDLKEVLGGFRGRFAMARVGVRLEAASRGLTSGPELIELFRRIVQQPGLQLEALHGHIAGEERTLRYYLKLLRQLTRLRNDIEAGGQGPITQLSFSGGLPPYNPARKARWAHFWSRLAAATPPGVGLAVELGGTWTGEEFRV